MANPGIFRWQPRLIRRVADVKDTGTQVVEVVTDAGPGFAKFLGNREGPQVLACEYIGTRLAGALGLPILDWHVFDYDGFPEIELAKGGRAEAGPAWITRRVEGFPWSGDAEDLSLIENGADFAKLILLDQWTLNCDRYRPPPRLRKNLGNVFFTREDAGDGFRLLAIDHTHIFTCGGELQPSTFRRLDRQRDITAFGLFPELHGYIKRSDAVDAAASLEGISDECIRGIVNEVPLAWGLTPEIRDALIDFLTGRRKWLLPRFVASIFPQDELFSF